MRASVNGTQCEEEAREVSARYMELFRLLGDWNLAASTRIGVATCSYLCFTRFLWLHC